MDFTKYIDHTLLKADAKPAEIEKLCSEAKEMKFAAVCVNPLYVRLASDLLKGSGVMVATVIGFPLGANTTKTKAFEASNAVENGADEIDMVISIGRLKAGNDDFVKRDIEEVVKASKGRDVKVILETCLLTNEEISKASKISADAGAAFVKTSTGFSTGGATVDAVTIMKEAIGGRIKIKASGGIRDRDTAQKMVDAGADRLGTSSGIAIVKG